MECCALRDLGSEVENEELGALFWTALELSPAIILPAKLSPLRSRCKGKMRLASAHDELGTPYLVDRCRG